jgi:anti-anti-sigma factor
VEVDERRLGGDVSVLEVRGDVDLGAGRELAQRLEGALGDGRGVVVDLVGCTFIDSSGLNALLRAARGSAGPDGRRRLAVHAPQSGIVRRLFSLTRTYDLLQVHDDLEGARAALEG